MLGTGEWPARARLARRAMAQAGLLVPGGWLAYRGARRNTGLPRFTARRLCRAWPGWPSFREKRPRLPAWPGSAAAAVAWSVAGIALFTLYLRMSRTVPVDSDGASNALQAWAMLHGNPLLRGWQLSDVSFFTTELPQYALLELARGLTPDVVHVAAAMTYTLIVLATAALAKGRAGGAAGLLRAALAAGVMAAPQAGDGVFVLLGSPDHTGSTVPVLAAWILLDRAPHRWPAAAGVCALLTWGLIADNVVLLSGVAPLATVAVIRAYLAVTARGGRLRAARFELALAAAALGAVGAARLAGAVITAAGGFRVSPVSSQLAAPAQLGGNLSLTARGLLALFGADFLGRPLGYAAVLAALHLAGIALAGWAVASVVRRFAGAGLTEQVLAAATLISLAGYLLSTSPVDVHSTREFVAVLPFGAALAGRVLAGRLHAARLTPALAAAATGYLLSMGQVLALPVPPPQGSQLAAWLSAQHLRYGLGGYWQASVVTLQAGGRVCVRPAAIGARGGIAAGRWEALPSWYDPRRHQADFVVLSQARPGAAPPVWLSHVRAAFGPPARIFYVGPYTVLVWNKNLLRELDR